MAGIQNRVQIRVHTENATMHIEHVRPRLHISQTPAKMHLETVMPSFTMDWDRLREETGLGSGTAHARQLRDKSYNDVLDIIAEISHRGDRAMDITSGEQVFVEIAKEQSRPKPVEYNVGTMPKSLPKMEWKRGSVNIEWEAHEMIMEWEPRFSQPSVSVDPYSIEIWLEDLPAVRFTMDAARLETHNRPNIVPKI